MVSVPLTLLLFLGMASAIQLARRAMPTGDSHTSASVLGGGAVDQLACEIAFATSIAARSATDLAFVTPDRSSDGAPETIRYQWSGVAGAPLTRQVNGSAAEALVPSVQDFGLTYDGRMDAQSGLQYCRAVNVRMIVPHGGTARIDARVETLNEPILP
jgi:hypothetical protein